jgi:hypothetical protein
MEWKEFRRPISANIRAANVSGRPQVIIAAIIVKTLM